MSRKHYIDLADRLRAERDDFDTPADYERAVEIAALFFAADNPRFDRGRFLDRAFKTD
jgi:hypothetical protein